MPRPDASIDRLSASSYRIPTESPESDGTIAWDSTTLVLAEASGGGQTGIGYSYADRSAADLIGRKLSAAVVGLDAMDVPRAWEAMRASARNLGRPGVASTAISAVDAALWDLKAKLLGVSLADLLGRARDAVPAYASGGFTSQSIGELEAQLGGWAAEGFRMVKMKVGRDPGADPDRVRAAREAIGPDVALFVDANGACDRKRALRLAERFAEQGVCWFEEPVSSDDPEGLRLLRDRVPAPMEVAAGEYAYGDRDFRALLLAGAVDVLQADATRCLGLTGFLRAGTLASAFGVPLSAHCAPSLHVPSCCALAVVRHVEDFYDHHRIEHLLFDGAPRAEGGMLRPDRSRPGLGLDFKRADAERFAT
ncbi:enolase C-terminal domain-like protein [Tautonia plasticadhaerens]|uniref:Mandelate racemase n=1 Tax=Tautonia plasticadhaerens TaxID=2527974 RepID=A0A518GUX6_9BACT|nr:enolase C-terminal domain-like protein [Tautonia plasticadhaerens]QDV32390.1 Mandelate racemase [Tautonia plasticadhaerens]